MPWTPLVLDTFVFDEAELETPESFGDMGGTQSIEQHDFPGGMRTQKAYGYFPSVLRWKAKFFGPAASDRAEAVKRILSAGREVTLQFAERSWIGRVAKFSPTVKHSWHYEYDLEFWPRVDFGSPGPAQPPPTDLGTMLSLHILSLQGLLTFGLTGNLLFQALAFDLGGPVGFLVSQVLDAVSAAGGVIGNITAIAQAGIYTASLAALAACQPYQDSIDPTQSSPAYDAAARIQAIQTIMTASQAAVAVVQVINPNLVTLASVYYGDYTQWRTIADANGLSDPQPLGSFSLTIPSQT